MNAHWFYKIRVERSKMCSCNTALMTSDDLSSFAQPQSTLQRTTWHGYLPLTENLHRHLAALRGVQAPGSPEEGTGT